MNETENLEPNPSFDVENFSLAEFDRFRGQSVDFNGSSASDNLGIYKYRMSVSEDGLVEISRAEKVGERYSDIEDYVDANNQLFDALDRTPRHTGTYEDLQELVDFFEKFGFSQEIENEVSIVKTTFPTPSSLAERLEVLREEEQRFYVPKIEIYDTGEEEVPDSTYLEIFARGAVPISTGSLEIYLHDSADNHMQAEMIHGLPLVDFYAVFAQTALYNSVKTLLDDSTVVGYAKEWFGLESDDSKEAWELYKEAKNEGRVSREIEAATVIDKTTGQFGDTSITSGNRVASPGLDEYEHAHEVHMQIAVDTLRVAGKLAETEVVRSLFETGQVQQEDEVTGAKVSAEIVRLARQRLGLGKQAA